MVPVHVSEQDRPLVRPTVEKVGTPLEEVTHQADAGACVDDQTRGAPRRGRQRDRTCGLRDGRTPTRVSA